MEEVFRQLGLLKAREIIWLLQILEIVSAVVLWIIVPGLIFWLVILGAIFVWYRVRKLGRIFVLLAGLVAIWFEWNFLAAFLAATGVLSWIGPLVVALTLLIVGICLCISVVCIVFFCRPAFAHRLASWLNSEEERNRDGRDCGLD